jgi:hypothetical protein
MRKPVPPPRNTSILSLSGRAAISLWISSGVKHLRDLLAFRALPHQANGIHAAEAMDRVLNRTLMTVRILAHVERANGKERIQSSTSPARMLSKVRSPQRGITQRMSTNSVWPWFSGSLHLNSQTSGPYWRFLRVNLPFCKESFPGERKYRHPRDPGVILPKP